MTKLEPNLTAALLLAREPTAPLTVPLVESLHEASVDEEEEASDGEWVDEVTSQVASLWAGRNSAVPFASAMASVEARGSGRRR